MSTKIFNGYQIKNMSLLQLQSFVLEIRKKIKKLHTELYHKKLAGLCAGILDAYVIDPPDVFVEKIKGQYKFFAPNDYAFLVAEMIIRERQKKIESTKQRDPEFDFSCEMVIIPVRRKIFMLLYTERKEFIEAIKSFGEVTEYPYWNNTDPPEGMPYSKWRRRGKEWDEVLSVNESKIPSLCGFGVTCTVPRAIYPKLEQVLSLMPSHEQRVIHIAKNSVINNYLKNFKEDLNFLEVGKLYSKTYKYLNTEQGQIELTGEIKRIGSILKVEYTKEDLLAELKF